MSDIADLSKGIGISKDQLSADGEQPCILYGELYTKYKSETIKEVISKTNIDNTKLVKSKVNDVIIPCSGETAEEIATARCILKDDILLGGDLNIIRLHGYDGSFMSYQLNGKRKYDIAKVAQGVSVVHLYGEHLKRIKTYNPTLPEQHKIAKFLSLIDERIETQKKIIEDLKKLKKEISKRIFSKQINFSKQKFLGDICTITTGKLDANAMTKNGKYLFFTCAYENYKTDTYAFEGKALLISGNGEVGLVKKYNGKFNAYQRTYVLQNFIENMDYIKCYIEYFLPKRIQKEKNVGAMPYIVLSTLYDMNIAIPSIETQNQISKIIDTIINFIECEYDIQAKYELQKQFLLRRMFI